MWDSKVTPFNSMKMGPKRDVVGELAAAVRKQGMKLGVANHGIGNFEFINPPRELAERMKAEKAIFTIRSGPSSTTMRTAAMQR